MNAVLLAGVDEAGRGPLAGPVVAAAVILDPLQPIVGLQDSKQLSATQRTRLAQQVRAQALAWSVAWADCAEIDTLNILGATFLAMRRALLGLSMIPSHIEIDGNRLPQLVDLLPQCQASAVVRGDATRPAISAASILAKMRRDELMVELDRHYPGFDLAIHKGYPTAAHRTALRTLAVSAIHRRSFAPVREALQHG
jgi:ribonuclease HII